MATKKSAKPKAEPKPPKVIKKAKEIAKKVVEKVKDVTELKVERIDPLPEPVKAELTAEHMGSMSLGAIMSEAWDSVKGASDPHLEGVTQEYLGILHAHAKSALAGSGQILQGDTELGRFEQACARLAPYYKGE